MTRLFIRTLMILVLAAALCGCATAFTGSAHVDDGPSGCMKKCKGWGLEFTGMVAMGEYSDACICSRPGKPVAPKAVAGAMGATAGVFMQMQREQQQNQ